MDDYTEGLRVERALAHLASISDPVARVRAADQLAEDARDVQAAIGQVRRRAIYEATLRPGHTGESVAAELGVSAKAVSAAISEFRAEDRTLFREAIELLMRPGASRTRPDHLSPGLTARDVLVQARLVLAATDDDFQVQNDDEFCLLELANKRARAIQRAIGIGRADHGPGPVALARREPINWAAVEDSMIQAVRTLDALPGIMVAGWLAHAGEDWHSKEWGVGWKVLPADATASVAEAGPHRDGWVTTEWLVWFATDLARAGFGLWHQISSAPPYLNEPGETATFWIYSNLSSDKPISPDDFAEDLRTTWDQTAALTVQWPPESTATPSK